MNHKADLTFGTIVIAVVVLVVVGVGTKVTWDLTSKPVHYLLGSANLSAFDDDIVSRYNMTRDINKEAIDSVDALLYSINTVAYFNTYNEKDEKNEKLDYSKFSRTFGAVEAKPTVYDRETVTVPGQADLDRGKLELAIGTISCWLIFEDKGNENTRCYSLTFEKEYPHLQELDELSESTFREYMKENKVSICNQFTKRFAHIPKDKCLDVLGDVSGGFFNPDNLEWDELPSSYFTSKEGKEISMCANNAGWNEIFFYSEENGEVCGAPLNSMAFGYKVKGFNLPQTVTRSDNMFDYAIEDWLYAYGDPQYILFYEVFPQEEAQYWEMSQYQIAWRTIFITETAFLGVDLITWGVGSKVTSLLKAPLQKLASKATKFIPFKGTMKGALAGVGKLAKTPLGYLSDKILLRYSTQSTLIDGAEAVTERTIQKHIKGQIFRKGTQAYDDLVRVFKGTYDKAVNELKDDAFDAAGRINPKGLLQLDENFKRILTTEADSDDALRLLKESLGDGYDDTLYRISKDLTEESRLAGFSSVSRAVFQVRKAQNLLREILVGDMTPEARKKALRTFISEGDDALSHMKPRDLRAFMANQNKAKDMLFKEVADAETGTKELMITFEGQEILDQTGKKMTGGELNRLLDDLLKDDAVTQLAPKTSLMIQGFSSQHLLEGNAGLYQKRHLVAAMAAYMAAREDSMYEKYYPQGTNVIGLKTPYMQTVTFKEFNTGIDYADINNYVYGTLTSEIKSKVEGHKRRAETILSSYGQEGHQGLLPEVNRYYLSLTKDQGLMDQDPQRFHLVSPCQTDLLVEMSTCDCYFHPDEDAGVYRTGEVSPVFDIDEDGNVIDSGKLANYSHFDGRNAMLYTLDAEGRAVKQCYPSSWFQFDDEYHPKCIKINPLMDNFGEDNYCYHGISPGDEIAKYTATAVQIGAAVGGGVVCGPPCAIGFTYVGGLLGEVGKGLINIDSQWPSHD